MSTRSKRTHVQVLICGMLAFFMSSALRSAAAEEGKKPAFDAAAEAAQAKSEDEQQMAERLSGVTGKYQKRFMGTFILLTAEDKKDQPNPEVVGSFVTSEGDKFPGRTYLVKIAGKHPEILAALKRYDCKQIVATGKLRNQEKYLIVMSIDEIGVTEPVVERRPFGGI